MEAATTLLTADLRKVLLDLGDRRVGGGGLLGAMATNAATARTADFQLALAGDKATSYANVRSRDIDGLMLRQAQTDAAMQMLHGHAGLPARPAQRVAAPDGLQLPHRGQLMAAAAPRRDSCSGSRRPPCSSAPRPAPAARRRRRPGDRSARRRSSWRRRVCPRAVSIGVVVSLTSAPGEGAQWNEAAEGARVAAYRYGLGDVDVSIVPRDDQGTAEGADAAVRSSPRRASAGS